MVKGLWPPCHQASVPMIWRQNHLWHVVGLWISQNSSAEFVWNKPPGRSFRTRQPAMPNAPTPSWGLSSNALEDLVTGLMDYTLELWSVCSLVENEHVVIWKIPSTFWKRRVREILQTEMQWPRTPVLVATTAQKCKETVHKEPVVLQKKSFLSQHSQVAGVSVSTAPYFATVCVFFFHGFGVMTHDVLSSDAKLENSRQLPKIHKTSWYHPGIILVSSMKFVEFITSLRAMLHATVHRVMQNSSAKVPPAVQRSIWLKSISCLGQEFPSSADPTSPTSHLRDSARLRDWDLNTTLKAQAKCGGPAFRCAKWIQMGCLGGA